MVNNTTEPNLLFTLFNFTSTNLSNNDVSSQVPSSSIFTTQEIRTTPATTEVVGMFNGPPGKNPMPLLIASPVAAVSILIMVCIAYYCHASQLDRRAKQLADQLTAEGLYMDFEIKINNSSINTPVLSSSDSDKLLCTQKRRNALLPPVPVSPNGSISRSPRASINWSAVADQELVNYTSPRRHSTFII